MRDPEDRPPSAASVNRRDFLKGTGVAAAATAVATAVHETAEAQAKAAANVTSTKPVAVKLNINGKAHDATVEPRTTLLDCLRNDLNLTGCKDVCDTSNCGACTVIIDGKATYACTKLAIEVQGKKITTVEGLVNGQTVDDVITAFIKHDATQCGYCTPGFVVAVRAFLNAHPAANLDEIRKGLGGNICRCGTYDGITKAALELATGKKAADRLIAPVAEIAAACCHETSCCAKGGA
ncbi:MAG: (2Fe-2S)-binding protein [Planctomycetales bacterium]|nr:(2Fe-2S)-binding protein [Planctomycetales bacterium]